MKTNKAQNKTTILITGATGFVGKQLVRQIEEREDFLVRLAVRPSNAHAFNHNNELIVIQDISATTGWKDALTNCDVVIHAAARVHVMEETAENPLLEYRKINVQGTMNLARQAAQLGVKRFIFISSIGVNGAETQIGRPYRPDDIPAPHDLYAISKSEAEQELMDLSVVSGMEIVIIRPTLIYGPEAKGNFPRMISWLQKGYPLPLKSIKNKRSLVSVYNLVDLIIRCTEHPRAANQIFLVSDGEDISIAELLMRVGIAMNKPVRLIPVPHLILKGVGTMTGKQQIIQKLCGSLQVDIGKTCDLLDWKPKVSMDDALHMIFPCIDPYINR